MFVSWVLFPLALAALCLGCGLLVEALTRQRLPGAVLPGVGLALIVVVGQFLTLTDATAELATPAVVTLAVAGLALGLRGRDRRPSGWAVAAALGVFAVYAAPIVLSGEATFAGYIKLDDTATWMALTDRVMEHGRSLNGLAPSTYEATLSFNLGDGYPIGVFLPLGVGSSLSGEDVAWVIQPYMAFLAALLGLALWELAGWVVGSRAARAAIAVVAAQPALLYGYYLWGGVKELAAIALIATVAVLLPAAIEEPRGYRGAPAALACAALIGVLSPGGAIWLVPALAVAMVVAVRRFGREIAARRAAGFLLLAGLLSVPALVAGGLLPPTSSPLTSPDALGNLVGSLDPLQIAGIWPAGDFRFQADASLLTYLAIAAALLGAGVGIAAAWRRGAWPLLAFILGALTVAGVLVAVGSPWVEGKAMAIASVAVPFAALLGVAALWAGGHRVGPVLLGLAVAAGVLWSNALAYRDVSLAPRDQLAELEEIGGLIAGEGPTLMTEYQPYGARHFLREADPEAVSELRRRRIPLRSGRPVAKGLEADTDQLSTSGLLIYRTLVLRRSPAQSRPPSPYRPTWSGDYYEVWQRRAGPAPQLTRIPLGSAFDPTGEPSCAEVGSLAARGRGVLLAARRPRPLVLSLADASYPPAWRGRAPGAPVPTSEGTVATTVRVRSGGVYRLWLRGSVKPQAELQVDGGVVGTVRHILNNQGQYVSFGSVELAPGRHEVALSFGGADLHPGTGGATTPIGPLVLGRGNAEDARIESLPASDARKLCGHRWDWIEARATR